MNGEAAFGGWFSQYEPMAHDNSAVLSGSNLLDSSRHLHIPVDMNINYELVRHSARQHHEDHIGNKEN